MTTGRALAFVDRGENPLRRMPVDLNPEQQFKETMNRLGKGLSGAIKQQQKQFDNEGRTDYYAVLCFEEGEQVTAFLRGLGYPEPEATFVDGPMLADILKIEIPKTEFRLKPLRKPDATLASLVTVIPKRVR